MNLNTQIQDYINDYTHSKRTTYFREYRRNKRGSVKRKSSGSIGEFIALQILSKPLLVRKPTHDIELGGLKIEVKSSLPREGKLDVWEFHTTDKQLNGCNYFFLACLDVNSELSHAYLVPKTAIKRKTIRIGISSALEFELYLIPID